MQSTIDMMSEWQRLYVVQVLSRTNPVVIVYSDKYVCSLRSLVKAFVKYEPPYGETNNLHGRISFAVTVMMSTVISAFVFATRIV